MKKKIILFFLTMMILTDDRRLAVHVTERAPIVDTYGRIFGFDDPGLNMKMNNRSDYFILNESQYHIRMDDEDLDRTWMNLNVFSHSGPSFFSKIIEQRLPLN